MKKLMLFLAIMLLVGVAPLEAQNSVDVLGGGPQPANTIGCAVNPDCIPATWSTTSNAGTDITVAITANFVFASGGGALPTQFPAATRGQICLADTRDLGTPTLFAQIAANCQAAGGRALLLIRDSAVNAPSAIPVFTARPRRGSRTCSPGWRPMPTATWPSPGMVPMQLAIRTRSRRPTRTGTSLLRRPSTATRPRRFSR